VIQQEPHALTLRKDADVLQLTSLVKQLTEYNQSAVADNTYSITLYEKAGQLPLDNVLTRLKSHILKGLRSHSKLAHLSRMHEVVTDHALKLVSNLKEREEGFALYLKFNAEELEKSSPKGKQEFPSLFSLIAALYNEPDTHIYVGKIFDLSILFRMIRKTNIAIICQLENELAILNTLKGKRLETVKKIPNQYNEPTPKEYLGRHAVDAGGIHQGSGTKTVEKRQISADKALLADLETEVMKLFGDDLTWKNAVVYYSSDFGPYVDRWATTLFSGRLSFEPILVNKVINTKNQLLTDTENRIEEHISAAIKSQFLQDKEKFTNFVTGWKDVTDAIRERRVERLYIQPEIRRLGFILDHSVPYSYPIRNAKRVGNIVPWLVHWVLAAGGDGVAAKAIKSLTSKQIAAKTRYNHKPAHMNG
jgi:hypothetical protein